jgi:hypothetical protein
VTFPLGAAVTIAELTADPHPALRRLRAAEPVSWLPALGGWLVTRRDLAEQVLRDARGFTVDDPRFTTARVVGPSMLSLDGGEHRRHRDPFARALRRGDVSAGLAAFCAEEAARLVAALAAAAGASGPGGPGGPGGPRGPGGRSRSLAEDVPTRDRPEGQEGDPGHPRTQEPAHDQSGAEQQLPVAQQDRRPHGDAGQQDQPDRGSGNDRQGHGSRALARPPATR